MSEPVPLFLRHAGVGDPPLVWSLMFWPAAVAEAKILTAGQYWHVADQLMELGRSTDPSKCTTLNIAKIGNCWELKEKGGPLGKINLRVFFYVDDMNGTIIVLRVHKKEDEAQLRRSVVVRIERHLRQYRDLGS